MSPFENKADFAKFVAFFQHGVWKVEGRLQRSKLLSDATNRYHGWKEPSPATYGALLPCSAKALRGEDIAERVEVEILYHKNEVRGEKDILQMRILQKIKSYSEIASNG
jgi:hypothetical protein